MLWFHVRRAARQQDAVERLEQLVEVALAEGRDQQGNGIRRLGHGGDVLFAHAVEGVRSENTAVRRNADQWFALSHV